VSPRPASISPLAAAVLPLAGATAGQLIDRLDPAPGDWMLVYGAAGGVGHLLVQLAVARGAKIAAVASPARHSLLRSLGVDVVVDRFQPDAVRAASEAAGGAFTAAADLVGQGWLPSSLPFIADGGKVGSIVELKGNFEE